MQKTLGKQFNIILSLKHDDEPDFLVIMLSVFCEDTDEKILEIETQHMCVIILNQTSICFLFDILVFGLLFYFKFRKPCLRVRPIATLIELIKVDSLWYATYHDIFRFS